MSGTQGWQGPVHSLPAQGQTENEAFLRNRLRQTQVALRHLLDALEVERLSPRAIAAILSAQNMLPEHSPAPPVEDSIKTVQEKRVEPLLVGEQDPTGKRLRPLQVDPGPPPRQIPPGRFGS